MTETIEEKITAIIKATLDNLGFEIVRVRLQGANFKVLEILIDRLDEQKITLADCRLASLNISALLDVEDIIKDKYYLEVASAGIERPLVKIEDYIKFLGREVKVRLKKQLEGAGHYQGKIAKVEDNKVYLDIKGQILIINLELIKSSNLILTDEMFKKLLNK